MSREKMTKAVDMLNDRFPPRELLKDAVLAGLDYLAQVDRLLEELAARDSIISSLRGQIRELESLRPAKEEMERKLAEQSKLLSSALTVARNLEKALPDKESSIPLSNAYHDLVGRM